MGNNLEILGDTNPTHQQGVSYTWIVVGEATALKVLSALTASKES
jgi:hypothetical protein